MSFNKANYLKAVEDYDLDVHKAMMEKELKHCSRAFFETTTTCEDVHNNFSESYNNTTGKARSMPLVEMLETIRRQTMTRIALRKDKSLKHKGKFSLKVGKVIKEEEKRVKDCTLIAGPNGSYEVLENIISHSVDLSSRTCICQRFNMTGIPCRHALKVINARKLGDPKKLDAEMFVSDWYLTTMWQVIYNDSIKPVNGMHFWKETGKGRIEPPKIDVTLGLKKNRKRFKGKHESPKKKRKANDCGEEETKVSKEGQVPRCAHYSESGHNKRSCLKVGCDRWPEPKKKCVKPRL